MLYIQVWWWHLWTISEDIQRFKGIVCTLYHRYLLTSQMIYHCGGEPERAMHCWFNVMAHKPWITAEFVTVCCSMSVVSNTLCSHFFGQWSYWGYTHALTKLHTEVMSWISRAHECRLCMDLPEANSTTLRDLYCLWVACPCLSWSAVAKRVLTWVVSVASQLAAT